MSAVPARQLRGLQGQSDMRAKARKARLCGDPCGTTCLVGKHDFPPRARLAGPRVGFCRMNRKMCRGSERVCAARPPSPIFRSSYEAEPVFPRCGKSSPPACCQGARNVEARRARWMLWVLMVSGASRFMRLAGADRPPRGGGFSGRARQECPERVAGKMEIRNDDSWQ